MVEARGRLGNRFTIKSKFLNVFKPAASSSSTFAVNNVNSFIFNKVSAFGGPCSRYDANCPGGENSAEVTMSAAVDPLANPMRRGYIENFCRKMLASNVGVDSFVTNIGSVTSTSPKQVDIEKVVHAFRPGYDIPSSVTNTLNVLLESAKSKGYSPKDQWRFLILPVCSSIAVEVL